ncbi:hypothetical protein MAHJHV58_00160 [Mycobacterium avium subsp. hominissuis]|uniref:hypothetical protein n=1 Tax=Mycobacterium avium TaxID=1764 RepID=UPI000534D0DA|nr:hypothetical protein [Mycobacterium avium]MCA4736661.1 hypothetical protein [Mycobacterium avium subsp. hominissuis]MCA4741246.1 hypothetical protein [Mycobacterium avium subsp. hominissuis]MCA4745949.1 hypothetical protein [Mycobacterium avium subsp. hominissuis]MCA4766119.1 hypothetical protein [Mycobacterium avium subsp. hominissuis]MDO2386083.1 hypothetical protein [Mycobacterium avium subsp. hominissuis]
MKVALYLGMLLLLGPILRVAGVAVSGLFLVVMLALGVYLIMRGKDRSGRAPQPSLQPQVVYVVPVDRWPDRAQSPQGVPPAVSVDVAGLHPARRLERPPLWLRGS